MRGGRARGVFDPGLVHSDGRRRVLATIVEQTRPMAMARKSRYEPNRNSEYRRVQQDAPFSRVVEPRDRSVTVVLPAPLRPTSATTERRDGHVEVRTTAVLAVIESHSSKRSRGRSPGRHRRRPIGFVVSHASRRTRVPSRPGSAAARERGPSSTRVQQQERVPWHAMIATRGVPRRSGSRSTHDNHVERRSAAPRRPKTARGGARTVFADIVRPLQIVCSSRSSRRTRGRRGAGNVSDAAPSIARVLADDR